MQSYYYHEWYEAFYNSGLDVMPHPYTITHNLYSIRNRNPKIFPQNSTLFGFIVHLLGHKDFENKDLNT